MQRLCGYYEWQCKLATQRVAMQIGHPYIHLASFAGISPEESGGRKKFGEIFFKTHLQAKTHREACGGG
jgi:hypothetical protein